MVNAGLKRITMAGGHEGCAVHPLISCCNHRLLVLGSPCHSWNITLPPECLIKWDCPSMQGVGLPSTPALKEGFPGARLSLLGRLWWRGWWERGWWVSYCLVNFRLKDPAQSQLCGHWNDHLVKPSAWCCSPSHMTGSWSDRVFTTSASLTGSFYPSQETFWLARNLPPVKLSTLLPRALRWHWRVIPSLVSGVIRSWEPLRAVHFALPSVSDISTLSPVSGIAKPVPPHLPQRGLIFPRLGAEHRAVGVPGLLFTSSQHWPHCSQLGWTYA